MLAGLKDLPLPVQILALVIVFLFLAWCKWLKHDVQVKEIECREKEEQEKTKRIEALTKQHKEEGDRKTDAVENSVAPSNKLEQKKEELFEQYEDEAVKSLNEDSPDTSNREKAPVHKPSKGEWIKSLLKRKKESLKI